ncbi:MAG: hypothetical protein ACTSWI_03610, partial [Alphaproteobacteria bacterium]
MKSQQQQPDGSMDSLAIFGRRVRPLRRLGVMLLVVATLAACGDNDPDTPVEAETDGPLVDDAPVGAEVPETAEPPAVANAERLDPIPAPDETIAVPPAIEIGA